MPNKAKTNTRKVQETKQESVLFRDLPFDNRSANKEDRTVEISFSSETPVRRWGEDEILSHDAGAVRLERAESNGPLLMDHNWNDQIGTIESIRIDSDRVGRAVVRFSKSERGSEIFQDVMDGIRKSISVGYRIHRVLLEEMSEDEADIYRVVDWEPLEISFVSVPADITVGAGRSQSEEPNNYILTKTVRTMDKDENVMPDNSRAQVLENEKREAAYQAQLKKDRESEASRMAAIRTIAGTYEGHGQDALVESAMRDGMSSDQFARELGEAIIETRKNAKPATHLDLEEGDVQRYSISRAILAQANNDWTGAEHEREISDHLETVLDRSADGILVPYDVQQREVTTTGAGAGGLGTTHAAGSFIESLRDNSILMQLGADVIPGLTGNLDIPRETGNATFGWVGEGADSALSDVSVGTLSMSPKTVTGSVAMTRRSLKQLNPAIDALVMRNMARGAGLAVDIAGIAGATGGDNPVGIMNTTGVLTNTIAAAGQPTWPEMVNFETLAAAANALAENSSYITTAAVRGYLKTAKKDAGSGIFLIEDNECNGYPVNVKTDAGFAANSILYGDFSKLLVAMWGVLDVVADTSTNAASNGLIVRMFQDMDFAVSQPSAFTKNV